MKITLNPFDRESIAKAIQSLKDYADSIEPKAQEIRKKAAELLKDEAEQGFNGAVYDVTLKDGSKVPDVKVTMAEDGSSVTAHGSEAVFAEFGAGVYFNGPAGSSPNPLNQGVYLIGTYGKGYGKRNVWGYYENGKLILTHGTPASMPMYHAEQEVIRRLPEIGKEVFKDK